MSDTNAEQNETKSSSPPRLGLLKKAGPLLIVLGAVAAVAILWAAIPKTETNLDPPAKPVVDVTVLPIEPVPVFADTFKLPAVVEANLVVDVAAELDGQLAAYAGRNDPRTQPGVPHIRDDRRAGPILAEGDLIQAGRPILYLNDDLIKAEHAGAAAQFEYEKKAYQRIQDAASRGVVTPRELDESETALAVSAAALQTATERLERTTIFAPIKGVINRLPVEVGEYVRTGETVAQIVDIETVKVVADVSERNIYHVRLGEAARINIDPLGGREVTGNITYISEVADRATRTTRVEITVDNVRQPDGRRLLRSGQIVTVTLNRGDMHDVIMVPFKAVIPLEDGKVVYVAQDGKAQPRPVTLGLLKGSLIQITAGLRAGDKLIVDGNRLVGPGQQISIIGTVAKAQP